MYKEIYVAKQPVPPPFEMTTPLYVYNVVVRILVYLFLYVAGFTYQYYQLNAYVGKDSRLKVMGFPCNQFGHQEPAANKTELLNGLRHVRPGSGFLPAFDIMGKGDVNGEKESSIYTYLKVKQNVCMPICHL